MHWRNFHRSAPSTTEDLEERAYRLKHWPESTRANFRIMKLQWARLFAWRLSQAERLKQDGARIFATLHHPMAGTRQLADWYRAGPQNPPPAVKKAIQSMRSSEMLNARARTMEHLASRDRPE